MAVYGKDAKLFVNGVEISKLLPVTDFEISVNVNEPIRGTLEFYLDNTSIDENGRIDVNVDKETFEQATKDRSLIF